METLDQIRRALERLSLLDRISIESWLEQSNEIQARISGVEEARAAYETPDPPLMTLAEFLEFEEKSPVKHEFVNGFVFAMTGGSLNHTRITQNIMMAFKSHSRHGPCEVFSSNVKIVIQKGADEISYYPDVLVDCRPDTRDARYVRDPKLIVEVLSPSTHRTDRREKLQNYRLLESLEEYVLAAQDERKLTIHRREDGWRSTSYAGLDAAAEFRSIGLSVPLTELYDGITSTSASSSHS